jgi:hypothetical protein
VLTDAPLRYAFACKAWRSGQSFLLEDADSGKLGDPSGFGKSLTWFSIEAGTPSRLCHAFEDQDINGYAISPDTSRIAVITSVKADPDYPAFLTVLDGSSCAELSRFKLEFPEKPRSRAPLLAPSKKYFDNVPFPAQFARQIAISPDNTKLALAYGISKGISGLAFFGVYSMGDGHRMATFKGDTYTPSLLATFIGDELSAGQAPLDGAMQFSIDSKSLYTSSLRVRQWDVSKLR